MDDAFEKFRKIIEIAKNYRYLDLENFISMSLSAAGYDLDMMKNVYIGKQVNYPGVFGVYDRGDKMYSYITNEHAEVFTKEYDDPGVFMAMFVQTAPNCSKYGVNSKHK